jgi:hypothetical protein
MTDIEPLVEQEVERLKQQDEVVAVAIVGSYARNPDSDHNDVDVYIVVDGDWRRRETKRFDGVVFEYFYNSMAWSKQYFKQDENWYTNYHWFTNADVRYDPDNRFAELQTYAEEQKDDHLTVTDDERERIRYNLWDCLQDLNRADDAQKTYLMDEFFDYLLRQYYLLEGVVPVKENYRITKLQEIDNDVHELACNYLAAVTVQEKEQHLNQFVTNIKDHVGDPRPEWTTEKEDFD